MQVDHKVADIESNTIFRISPVRRRLTGTSRSIDQSSRGDTLPQSGDAVATLLETAAWKLKSTPQPGIRRSLR